MSALRMSLGMAAYGTWPRKVTRSATPTSSASARSRRWSGSDSSSPGRAARDHQLGAGDGLERADRGARAARGGEPADVHQARPLAARERRAVPAEALDVDAAGHDRDVAARHAQADQLGLLARAGGDHRVGAAADGTFQAEADAGVGAAAGALPGLVLLLVPPAERVERLGDRYPEPLGAGDRGEPAGPRVGVDHVGPLAVPAFLKPGAEVGQVRQQPALGQPGGRAGRHVLHGHPGGEPSAVP
jgi:hypothetical protein